MLEVRARNYNQSLGPAGATRTLLLFLALVGICIASASARAAGFTASLNPQSVAVGESATLTLTFQGGEPKVMPTPPEIPGLRIDAGGSSQNVTIVNGQYSANLIQQFGITPLKEGVFTIPPMVAEVGGQKLASQPLRLVATKAAASSRLAFLRLVISEDGKPTSRTNFYLGEVLTVELQVFVNDGVANGPNILAGFDQYSGPLLKADGFSTIKTARSGHFRTQEAGVSYTLTRLVTSLSANKPGPLTIGSIEVPLELQLPVQGQRRRDIFSDFGFFGQQYQSRKVVLTADPITVNILPLPPENVPPGFQGAVGTYAISASAGPTNVAAGDPVTVKIQVAGRGNLEALTAPDTSGWKDFKSYPPTSTIETSDPLGLNGVKTFEQVVVPQNPTVQNIPSLAFSFFDPSQKTYRTVSSRPIPLIVRPAGSQAAPTIAAARGRDESAPPTADIVHIKPKLGTLAQMAPPAIARPWFYGLQLLPVLAMAGALVYRKRTDMLANNPRLRRKRQVDQVVRDGLKELHELAAANQSEEFFAALFRLLQERLGERLDLPASAITEAVIEEHLRPRGVSDELLTDLQDLFQACNQARYAPVQTSQELQALMSRVEPVFQELEGLEI